MSTILQPIAVIHNDYREKFGIPRQSGLVDEVVSAVIFEKQFRNPDALRGIEGYSHLWLIWKFDVPKQDKFIPTVRPPKLGGNTRMGVFASRSPFRPNPLGLSCVKLVEIQKTEKYGDVLIVKGADLKNGSEIFDIKPYLPYADSFPDAVSGFALSEISGSLEVIFPESLISIVPNEKIAVLKAVLAQDPRPAYQNNPERIYTMSFGSLEVSFRVNGNVLTVTDVKSF